MTKETVKAFYVGSMDRIIVTDSKEINLVDVRLGDDVKIREDIDDIVKIDGFYLYNGMKEELKSNGFTSRITDVEIDPDSGLITLGLNNSGYTYPITVLEALQNYDAVNIENNMNLLYDDVQIGDVSLGDRLRVKPDVVIGEKYGLYSNIRYFPERFDELAKDFETYIETHDFALPGEFVTVHRIDDGDNTVFCADEDGVALWYGIEMLQKPLVEESRKTEHNDDPFIEFAKALGLMGAEVPQVEVDEEPRVTEEFDDSWLYDDDDLLDFDDDYGDFPIEERSFYKALEDLKYATISEDNGSIWIMTNGERALTFKDDRLVDVRLAEHIENFVYFSAPIQMKDLSSRWALQEFVNEEVAKLNEIIAIAESLKDESLVSDLLDIISRYRH